MGPVQEPPRDQRESRQLQNGHVRGMVPSEIGGGTSRVAHATAPAGRYKLPRQARPQLPGQQSSGCCRRVGSEVLEEAWARSASEECRSETRDSAGHGGNRGAAGCRDASSRLSVTACADAGDMGTTGNTLAIPTWDELILSRDGQGRGEVLRGGVLSTPRLEECGSHSELRVSDGPATTQPQGVTVR